jgi:signal transduction histidine kinase
MKRFSSKIMLIVIGCSTLTALFVGWLSFLQGSTFIKLEVNDKLQYMAQSYANEFSQTFVASESYVAAMHAAIVATFDGETFAENPSYITEYLPELDIIMERFAASQSDALGIYVTFNPDITDTIYEIWYQDLNGDGILTKVTSDTPFENSEQLTYPAISVFTPEEESMAYLYRTMAERRPIWFEPYQEIGLDVTSISYVMPLIIDDVVIGVVGMDMDFADIEATITNMEVYQGGQAYLLNEQNAIIAPRQTAAPALIQSIVSASAGKINHHFFPDTSGIFTSEPTDKNSILAYCHLSNGWNLILHPAYDEILKPVRYLTAFVFLSTLLGALIAVALARFFSNQISQTMDSAVSHLKKLESGDFSGDIDPELLRRSDDLGHFIRSVDTMRSIIAQMADIIEDSKDDLPEAMQVKNILSTTKTVSQEAIIAAQQIIKGQSTQTKPHATELSDGVIAADDIQGTIEAQVQKTRQKDILLIYQSRLAQTGQLIGYITHQWRQPLNSLAIILAELKDAQAYGELESNYLGQAVEKCQAILSGMSSTIDDFRDFTKPSRQKESFAIAKCVNFALDILAEGLRNDRIKVQSQIDPDALLYGYANEFTQVLTNIISNAQDALRDTLRIQKTIKINTAIQCDAVVVSIFDNGNRIPEATLSKLFTPYFSTKTEGHGTGLGLYLAKMIVEDHLHGSIEYHNVKNGVECLIRLPREDAGIEPD